MNTYRIPLIPQMYGHCDINANSHEDAIEIVPVPDTPLSDGSHAVDDPENNPGQVEIMLSDLLPEAQKAVMRVLGISSPADGNYDVTPLFIVFDNSDSAIDQDNGNKGGIRP